MAKDNFFFKMDMLILLVLHEGDRYGYEIVSILKKMTDGVIDLKLGTLYPVLYRLIDEECISSTESVQNRRVRVYYHIEKKGEERLQQLLSKYLSWSKAISKVIDENWKGNQ